MKLEDSTAYTARCFRGDPASCACACPFHLDVRGLLDKVGRRRWLPAYKMLCAAVVFPSIVAALCDQPCRERCQRTLLGDEAIAIRDIEAACLRHVKSRKPDVYVIPPKEQRVAVVGAGVSGLACALNLAQKRYQVTVFEKEAGWGGSLRSHPRFIEFDADIALQFSTVEVEFRLGMPVSGLAELAGFDAVYVATGSGGDSFGLLDSWDPRVFATAEPKVFLGGSLTGATVMEALAQGLEASKVLEIFLQTGKASRTSTPYDRDDCGRALSHTGATSAPRVEASQPEGYTAEEAQAEADRCLQCDCDQCLAACEMLRRFRKDPKKIGVEVYTDMTVNPPLSSRTVTREVYSCNLCGYCGSVCPEGVDMGELLQFSRAARCSAGVGPAALHDYWLREMDFATSEGSFASAAKGRETCEYAFYPGCQLGACNPEHVLRSYDALAADRDTGIFLSCCGAPAYWAGDDERFRAGLEATKAAWEKLGRPTLVFACATCMKLFALFLPEIPRVSLYELLAASRSAASGAITGVSRGSSGAGLQPAPPFAEAAVFDPCASRGDEEMQAAVRDLAGDLGVQVTELDERNRCCGHGGHISLANPSLYDEITRNRAEASDKPYVVYCANCREVFASREKDCAHILDVFFGLGANAPVPTLEQKRENSLRVKKELMKQTSDMDFQPERHEWDALTLKIGADLQKDLDKKLISAADLKEAIWSAESSGDMFYDETDDVRLCSMIKPVITYWVEYREAGPQTYEVLSAYYHRMRFREGE
jgi:Fe-S oxidoreductase